MRRGLRAGAIAGAVGTLALDVAGYADMVVQGRPASELPGRAAQRLAETAGVDALSAGDDATASRRSAVGALLGYSTGVALGAAYGVVAAVRRPHRARLARAALIGGTAMAAANGPMVAQGLTDPRTWGTAGWISDIVPHVVYGLTVAAVFDAITD